MRAARRRARSPATGCPLNPVSSANASWSPRALMMVMASSLSASVASSLNSRIAARASEKARLAPLLVSLASAASIAGSIASSWVLKTDCAASMRLGGIGRQQRQAAERGLDVTAQLVVEAHGGSAVGNAGDGRTGQGVDDLAVGLLDVDLLAVGIGHQPTVLQRADDGIGAADCRSSRARRWLPRVSENSSLANLPTASSNGPAKAGNAKAIRTIAERSVRRQARKLAGTGDPGRR